jgi:hypothetical protein
MDASFSPLLHPLHAGDMLTHCGGRGRGIAVFKGRVWLTQTDDLRDVILTAGESFDFDRPGVVVVQAFENAGVLWFDRSEPVVPVPVTDDALQAADGSRITAFALHRAARDMRNAALARALVRVAGAVSFAWTRAALAWRRLLDGLVPPHDCRGLQRS